MKKNELKAKSAAPIVNLMRPLHVFAGRETSGGIVLLLCTLVALVWANSPWYGSYAALWHTQLSVGAGGRTLSHDLHFWVNDGLMAIFFFVVGLEIKREMLVGELASLRKAAFPIAGALGGVVAPALLYTAFNRGGPGAAGWGIPMATDIAFVIGVMALLGDIVPLGLRVFLTALAIVDDIVAVLVIAVFYTAEISIPSLLAAGLCLAVLAAFNWLGVRHPIPYALVGVLLWASILESGVHATIAGVLLAMLIPARTAMDHPAFLQHAQGVISEYAGTLQAQDTVEVEEHRQMAIEALEDSCEKVQSPLHRLEHALHPWVTFAIMPLFALANAGVRLGGDLGSQLGSPVASGVTAGLLFGKPLGITLLAWLAVRAGLAALPEGLSWLQVHAAGWLGGIGFTMSLFLAALAFNQEPLLVEAKVGILAGSLAAGMVGSGLLWMAGRRASVEGQ
ncbi:MAG: Na+/H+ antiporter NhaA [Acidobacteria bacterium]|nr:Na+/H+ antiporter NhaA [Acidobacteriota bacterium]